MILAVDVGNTHISLGAAGPAGEVSAMLQIPTDPTETSHGYAARLQQVLALEGIDVKTLEGAAMACVRPPVAGAMREAVRLLLGQPPLVVGAGIRTGLPIAIDDPGTLAGDLVAAAVAARALYPLPCVIVDAGTATTLTVVDGAGRYIGGCILPGAAISLEALASRAALLPLVEIQPPRRIIATDTADSLRGGILYGAAGAIDGVLDRFEEALGAPPAAIVATGGLGAVLCPHCRHAMRCDPALVLRGLGLIWQRNRAPQEGPAAAPRRGAS